MSHIRKVTVFEYRGQLYRKQELLDHLDSQIGAVVTQHAHKLVHIDKYAEICDFLEANLQFFANAHAWKQDRATVESMVDGEED